MVTYQDDRGLGEIDCLEELPRLIEEFNPGHLPFAIKDEKGEVAILEVKDVDGDGVANGTPHAAAIFAAWERR